MTGSAPTAARRIGHGEVLALLAAMSFVAARFLPLLEIPVVCPMRALADIPCATCGMTHAFVRLAHGELARALAASPLGALLAAASWAYAAVDGLRLAAGRPWPALRPGVARAAGALAVGALLLNWAWLVLASRGAA